MSNKIGKQLKAFGEEVVRVLPDIAPGTGPFAKEVNRLREIGHAATSFFSAIIVVAIIAVLLSKKSSTASLISSFFNLIKWAVGNAIQPVQQVPPVSLTSSNNAPAGNLPSSSSTTGGQVGSDPGTVYTPWGNFSNPLVPSTTQTAPASPTTPGSTAVPPGQIPTLIIKP